MENQIDTKTWHNPLSTGIDLDEIHATERKRVLVVADEIDTIFLLKHILRLAGFNVLGATSDREALKKCTELKPDLALPDLMMPEMDGWQTYDYLRRVSNVPVIILSALGSKEELVRDNLAEALARTVKLGGATCGQWKAPDVFAAGCTGIRPCPAIRATR